MIVVGQGQQGLFPGRIRDPVVGRIIGEPVADVVVALRLEEGDGVIGGASGGGAVVGRSLASAVAQTLGYGIHGAGISAFVLALARQRCSAATAAQLDARLAALSAPGPEVSGKSLLGIELLPPHMRGMLMSQLNVLCRLRGEPVQLVQTAQLTEYLSSTCDGLLERLYAEWYVDRADGADDTSGASRKRELKTLYAPQRGGRKK